MSDLQQGIASATPPGPEPSYKPWTAQVRKDLIGPELADKDLNDFVSSYKTLSQEKAELEGKLKEAVFPPKEGASETEVQAFRKALGVPEKPEEYDLKAEGVPAAEVEALKQFAIKNHLTRAQTAELFSWQRQIEADRQKVEAAKRESQLKEAEKFLLNEYRDKANDKLNHALRLIEKIGGAALKKELEETGAGNSPELIKFVIKVAEAFNEDGIAIGSPGSRAEERDWNKIYPSMAHLGAKR